MGIAPLAFTGVSQFSSDFQTILNRAAQIAQIPVRSLQNKDSDVLQRKSLLEGLRGSIENLASSVEALGTLGANQAIGASSSNSSAVSVTSTGASQPITYTIGSVTSAASAASERTTSGYADSAATPVGATGSFRLVVGSHNYSFTLSNNTLVGLRDKINSLGAGVNASILTTGTGNYLSVAASATGQTTLQLIDDPDNTNTNLLTTANQGTNAVFSLNGINVSQAGNVVNSIIPGVTFTILGSTQTAVTLSLRSDRNRLSAALSDFVSKYNAAHDALAAQSGASAGLLSGDTAVTQLNGILRQLTSYRSGSGSVQSLGDLGIEFSSSGWASFNSTTFDALPEAQVSEGFSVLGSATQGVGHFSAALKQFSDPVGGLLKLEQAGLDRTDRTLQSQIQTLNDRITIMQASLTQRLQLTDALLGTLESQQRQVAASIQGLNVVLYGKNTGQ